MENSIHVIDGGFLLHRVFWDMNDTFYEIIQKYISYIKNYFQPGSTIVFDGYPNSSSDKGTKNCERRRRSKDHLCPEIRIQEDMKPIISKDKFLLNDKNKKQLIDLLKEKLKLEGYYTVQATEDADVLIIEEARKNAQKYDKVIVVGTDVDLLVILSSLPKMYDKKIYFLMPSQGKVDEKLYSVGSFSSPEIAEFVLVLHALSGCDTTSAFFRKGKKNF